MFIGVVVGIIMLTIGKNTQTVADLAEQLGFIVDGIMGIISKIVPVFVFGSLFNIISSSSFGSLTAGGRFFAGTLAGCILLMLLHLIMACVRMRITPPDLLKRTSSTFAIAISTASSSAAFVENKKTCVEKLGMEEVSTSIPFRVFTPEECVDIFFAEREKDVAKLEKIYANAEKRLKKKPANHTMSFR